MQRGKPFQRSEWLAGEIFAMEYAEREKEPADYHTLSRYIKSRGKLLSVRKKQKGIIGVSFYLGGRSPLYSCSIPGRKDPLRFRNPVQAVAFYNQYVTDKFGKHAVLCDPLAVLKEFRVELTA